MQVADYNDLCLKCEMWCVDTGGDDDETSISWRRPLLRGLVSVGGL